MLQTDRNNYAWKKQLLLLRFRVFEQKIMKKDAKNMNEIYSHSWNYNISIASKFSMQNT